jgi:PAS domain S-box-containing protein
MVAAGSGLIWIAYTGEQNNAFQLLEKKADYSALIISSYTTKALEGLTLFAATSSLDNLSPKGQKKALEDLLFARKQVYTELTLVNIEGYETTKLSLYHTYLPDELVEIKTDNAFMQAANGSTYISQVYICPRTGLLSVQMAVPVRAGNNTISQVLKGIINVAPLWQDFTNIWIGQRGYTYLVDSNGYFIAYQDLSDILRKHGDNMNHIPPVAEFQTGVSKNARHVSEYQGLMNDSVIGVFAPIPDTDWAVIVELPTEEAYADITRMLQFLAVLILICTALAGIFGYGISRQIVKPIQYLTLTAESIGRGNLNTQVADIKRQDEVGVLARTFSHMQEELKSLYLNLERKVEDLDTTRNNLLIKNEELNAAYKNLAASEKQYRTILENIQDVFYRSDNCGKLVMVSPSGASLLGYNSTDEMIGLSISENFYANPIDREQYLKTIEENGILQDYEVTLKRKDKSVITVSTNSHIYYHPDGSIAGFEGIFHDITLRKKAETELQNSHSRFQTVLDRIGALVYVVDMQSYEILFVNKYGEDIWGEAIGKTCWKTFQSKQSGPCPFCIHDRKNSREEDLSGVQIRELFNSSINKWYECRYSEILWPDGRVVLLNISADITDRKKAEEDLRKFYNELELRVHERTEELVEAQETLRQTNKKMNLLSSITRHDINNQIFSLKGLLHLSKETLADVNKTSDYIAMEEKIANSIERHIHFTEEYQDLGVHEPVWQNVQECFNTAKKSLLPSSITCIVSLDNIYIYADPLFEKVVYTLIDNTLRHGKKVTQIRLFHQITENDNLHLLYEDDGVGISDLDKDNVFNRGFGRNTGFGLFLAREILSITDLSIRECGNVGNGVRFEILVPKGKFQFKNNRDDQGIPDEHDSTIFPINP